MTAFENNTDIVTVNGNTVRSKVSDPAIDVDTILSTLLSDYVEIDSSSNTVDSQLPLAVSSKDKVINIKWTIGGNTAKITTSGSDTVDGSADITFSDVGDSYVLRSNGTEWKIDSAFLTAAASVGDMTKAVYDPNTVSADAFDQDNMVDGSTNKNFTATEKTKLTGIETAAEVNPTNAETKTAYEANADTNAFTDAEQTKLGNIETAAQVNVSFNSAYEYDNTTAKADPGPGLFRLNNADPTLSTEMYIDDLDKAGIDMSAWLLGLSAGKHLRLGQTDSNTSGILFEIVSVVDETSFFTITIIFVVNGTSGITDAKTYSFQFEGGGGGGGGDEIYDAIVPDTHATVDLALAAVGDEASIYVKTGSHVGFTAVAVTNQQVTLVLAPSVIFTSAIIVNANDFYMTATGRLDLQDDLTFNGDCNILNLDGYLEFDGLITLAGGAGGIHSTHTIAGLTGSGIHVTGDYQTINIADPSSVIDGGTTRHALRFENFILCPKVIGGRWKTTAGGGTAFLALSSGAELPFIKDIFVDDSDGNGISIGYASGPDGGSITNCNIKGCDGNGIYAGYPGMTVSNNHTEGSAAKGITVQADNVVITSNTCEDNIEIVASKTRCLVAVNRVTSAVTDAGTGSLVANNLTGAF